MSNFIDTVTSLEIDQEDDLEMRMIYLWELFDHLSDEHYRQLGDRRLPQTVTAIDVSNAEMSAIDAQQAYYRYIYENYECECTPISNACRVCRAYIGMNADYRI